eukprot:TRINITY_DN50260_c0_g1_i1.p2 TRINITY_DN50260_c0_g1~~TRINITY_DN50260_c0_g1_i1.p2  ORF type:complete len:359 (+),score=91.67 TRINITY_DN50260_c0_g1_i1:115-1077(+)
MSEEAPLLPQPEARSAARRSGLAALGAVCGVALCAFVTLPTAAPERLQHQVTVSREATAGSLTFPSFLSDAMTKWCDALNRGDVDALMAMHTQNPIYVGEPRDGFLVGREKIRSLLNLTVQRSGGAGSLKMTVQSAVVAGHAAWTATAVTSGADTQLCPAIVTRWENHGSGWKVAGCFTAWGANSHAFRPEKPPRVPTAVMALHLTLSQLWGRVSMAAYAKLFWSRDAVIYQSIPTTGMLPILRPAELVPALREYAKNPGCGAGSVEWTPLVTYRESDSVLHEIGCNKRAPEMAPWYLRLEKNPVTSEWQCTAEVVSLGY